MAELSALRARLKDRQVKAGALGTTEVSICLDVELISELSELEEQQAQWSIDHPASAPGRWLEKSVAPAEPAVDAQIEAKQAEIRAASIIVVFRALSSQRYQEIVNRYEDPDDKDQRRGWTTCMAACYIECWSEGEKVDVPWSEIRESISFGELFEVRTKVWDLNRRKQDIPFSLRPSKSRRQPAGTPKPA
jgi:hypothetical protein